MKITVKNWVFLNTSFLLTVAVSALFARGSLAQLSMPELFWSDRDLGQGAVPGDFGVDTSPGESGTMFLLLRLPTV